jgi:hypothetical protein
MPPPPGGRLAAGTLLSGCVALYCLRDCQAATRGQRIVQHQPTAAATSDTRLLESTSGRHPEPQLSQAPAKAVQPMVPPGPVKPELPLATAAATLPPEPLLPPVPSPQVEASPRAEVAPAPEPEATLSFAPICVRDGSIAVGVVYDAVNVQWDEVTHQTAAATNGANGLIIHRGATVVTGAATVQPSRMIVAIRVERSYCGKADPRATSAHMGYLAPRSFQ